MGIMTWLGIATGKEQPLQRSLTYQDVWGPDSRSLFDVSNENALRLVPVYAATSYIADQLSLLPGSRFRESGGNRLPVHGPSWLDRPDPRVSRFDWMHQFATSVMLRGNAYGIATGDGAGGWHVRWLHPQKVRVDELTETYPIYHVAGVAKPQLHVAMGGNILHIPGYVFPGSVVGLSPVGLFKRQFEAARGAVEYGAEWFDKSATPAGILKSDQAMNPDDLTEAKDRFKEVVTAGETVALDKNWSWEQVTLKPEEAQFLQTIKASATQIAAIWRVDPSDIGGESGGSLTYATVEGNQRKFNDRTLHPWVKRFEEGIVPLLPADERYRLNLDAHARPNLLERVKATGEQLRNGTLTNPEARALDNKPPLTPQEIEDWQRWYATNKSMSESISESVAESITSITEGTK